MDRAELKEGRLLSLTGNTLLFLNDPEAAWIIESGSIIVFVVASSDGLPQGPRRYLFTATTGTALFGAERDAGSEPCALAAVPIQEATVREIPIASFGKLAGSDASAAIMLEEWIRKLGAALPKQAREDALATIRNSETLSAALSRFHAEALSAIASLQVAEEQDGLQRLRKKERLELEITQNTFGALAAASKSGPDRLGTSHGSPLFVAVHAIGHALGLVINPAVSDSGQPGQDELDSIVRTSRVRIRRVLLTPGWWEQSAGPLLGYTRDMSQPVALLPSRTRYELFDPVTQTRNPVDATSAAALSPVAYVLYRPLPDAAMSPRDLLRFTLRGHGRDLAGALLAGTAATVLGMLTPLATAILIDKAIPDADRGFVLQMALGLAAAIFGRAMFELFQGLALLRVDTASTATVQAALWDRLLNLRPSFFRAYSTGDLYSRAIAVTQAHDKLSAATIGSLFLGFVALLNLLLMLYYSVSLALVAVFIALILVLVTTTSGVLVYRQINTLELIRGRVIGLTVQLINGVSKLRVAGAERFAFVCWANQYREQQTLTLKVQQLSDFVSVLNQALPAFAATLIFWFAARGLQAAQGQGANALSVGIFLAFNAAFGLFLAGASVLSVTVIDLVDVSNLWARAKPIIEATPEVDSTKTHPGRLTGRVALDHVTFRYRDDGPLILDDVSLRAEPGQFIAVVGPSGSGKSTLLRLLLGFERAAAGTILYDGQDLAGLDVYAVRRQLGVVLQNSNILSASIFDNIASGASISLEDAWAAARAAGLDEDITQMPMGMYTFVSEGGTNLAVGQRQRLLIARALASKPRIVLFDEATSALDNRTQAIVQQSLEALRITRLVIAHRLSTVRSADRIYVLEGGRIVQHGTFSELARQDGLFTRFMARQMM